MQHVQRSNKNYEQRFRIFKSRMLPVQPSLIAKALPVQDFLHELTYRSCHIHVKWIHVWCQSTCPNHSLELSTTILKSIRTVFDMAHCHPGSSWTPNDLQVAEHNHFHSQWLDWFSLTREPSTFHVKTVHNIMECSPACVTWSIVILEVHEWLQIDNYLSITISSQWLIQVDQRTQSIPYKNSPNHYGAITSLPRQIGTMRSWGLRHTRTLPSALTDWNCDSSNQAIFFSHLGSNLYVHKLSRAAAVDDVLFVKVLESVFCCHIQTTPNFTALSYVRCCCYLT